MDDIELDISDEEDRFGNKADENSAIVMEDQQVKISMQSRSLCSVHLSR